MRVCIHSSKDMRTLCAVLNIVSEHIYLLDCMPMVLAFQQVTIVQKSALHRKISSCHFFINISLKFLLDILFLLDINGL